VIPHRARQFLDAGRTPTAGDFALAREYLEPDLLVLFARQHPRDIVHAAATARWLLTRGYSHRELIAAALLHDIGKGEQRRIDRAVYVVADSTGLAGRFAQPRSRFAIRRALARTRDHSSAGAAELKARGAPERVVELTLNHHGPPGNDTMLALLQQADAES